MVLLFLISAILVVPISTVEIDGFWAESGLFVPIQELNVLAAINFDITPHCAWNETFNV